MTNSSILSKSEVNNWIKNYVQCSSYDLHDDLTLDAQKVYILYEHLPPFSTLPFKLGEMEHLEIKYTDLTHLPELPLSLKVLKVDNNQLCRLPNLPPNLEELECNNNQLTELPLLPQNLKYLNVSDNPLKIIPILPKNLNGLGLSGKKTAFDIASLILPQTLKYLILENSNIKTLPILPNNLEMLIVNHNPQLSLTSLSSSLINVGFIENDLNSHNVNELLNLPSETLIVLNELDFLLDTSEIITQNRQLLETKKALIEKEQLEKNIPHSRLEVIKNKL